MSAERLTDAQPRRSRFHLESVSVGLVDSGLVDGDRVVTDGLQKIRPGGVARPTAAPVKTVSNIKYFFPFASPVMAGVIAIVITVLRPRRVAVPCRSTGIHRSRRHPSGSRRCIRSATAEGVSRTLSPRRSSNGSRACAACCGISSHRTRAMAPCRCRCSSTSIATRISPRSTLQERGQARRTPIAAGCHP